MKKLTIILLIFLTISVNAQERSRFLYAGFSDKSVSQFPFTNVFGSSFDPSLTLGAGMDYRQNGNFTLFQTFQLTGFKTRLIGNGITLSSSFGYRYGAVSGFFGEAMAGLGISAFLPSRETFAQSGDGVYVPVNPLIVRAAVPFDLLFGYKVDKLAFYLQYRYAIIGPYTDVLYAPRLGVMHLGIGIRYSL